MKPVRVPCHCCKGDGTIELTGAYLETLVALRKAGETWAANLAEVMGCQGPAMSNRLAQLEAKGLVSHRRDGVRKLYRVTEQCESLR